MLRGAALNQFLLRKHGRNWDDTPMPGVGLADPDGRALDEFRRRGVASGRLPSDAGDESDGDLMEMLRLREGHDLRRAAVLLFHPDLAGFFAGAFVKIGYFRTETDLAYQDVIEGNLFAHRILRQLVNGTMSKADFSRGLGQKTVSGQLNKVIRLLIADGSIGYMVPEKPRSRLQMYRLTDRGEGLSVS